MRNFEIVSSYSDSLGECLYKGFIKKKCVLIMIRLGPRTDLFKSTNLARKVALVPAFQF